MKILWHSNAPFAPTGYGSQTGIFAPLIRDAGHDVAISAFWGLYGKALDWDGIKLYPGTAADYGDKWLPAYTAAHGDGDPSHVQVITLMDVWVLNSPLLASMNIASWVPVDHDPAPPKVIDFFTRTGATPIAMSRFGEDKLREAGLDPLYVPHGVDTDLLRPIPQADVRKAMGIDPDAFVVGMVAANQGQSPPRKAFPQVFEAFAEFHRRHQNSLLYMHTVASNPHAGMNLPALAQVCGIPEGAVVFTPEYELQVGVDYSKMAWVYSNMDVLAAPSYGEGFGIPIVEAQACGVPVIVNDFTAMHELAGPADWKTTGERWYDMAHGAWFQAPHVAAILDRLEQAYDARGDEKLKTECRQFAEGYDARTVMAEHWVPTLAKLEDRLTVPQVRPGINRAQRRAAERAAKAAA